MSCLIPGAERKPDMKQLRKRKYVTDHHYHPVHKKQQENEVFYHIDRFEWDTGQALLKGRPGGWPGEKCPDYEKDPELNGENGGSIVNGDYKVNKMAGFLRKCKTEASVLIPPAPVEFMDYGKITSKPKSKMTQIRKERRAEDFYGVQKRKEMEEKIQRDERLFGDRDNPVVLGRRIEAQHLDYQILPDKRNDKKYYTTYGRGYGSHLLDPILRGQGASQALNYRIVPETNYKVERLYDDPVPHWQREDVPPKSNYRGRPHTSTGIRSTVAHSTRTKYNNLNLAKDSAFFRNRDAINRQDYDKQHLIHDWDEELKSQGWNDWQYGQVGGPREAEMAGSGGGYNGQQYQISSDGQIHPLNPLSPRSHNPIYACYSRPVGDQALSQMSDVQRKSLALFCSIKNRIERDKVRVQDLFRPYQNNSTMTSEEFLFACQELGLIPWDSITQDMIQKILREMDPDYTGYLAVSVLTRIVARLPKRCVFYNKSQENFNTTGHHHSGRGYNQRGNIALVGTKSTRPKTANGGMMGLKNSKSMTNLHQGSINTNPDQSLSVAASQQLLTQTPSHNNSQQSNFNLWRPKSSYSILNGRSRGNGRNGAKPDGIIQGLQPPEPNPILGNYTNNRPKSAASAGQSSSASSDYIPQSHHIMNYHQEELIDPRVLNAINNRGAGSSANCGVVSLTAGLASGGLGSSGQQLQGTGGPECINAPYRPAGSIIQDPRAEGQRNPNTMLNWDTIEPPVDPQFLSPEKKKQFKDKEIEMQRQGTEYNVNELNKYEKNTREGPNNLQQFQQGPPGLGNVGQGPSLSAGNQVSAPQDFSQQDSGTTVPHLPSQGLRDPNNPFFDSPNKHENHIIHRTKWEADNQLRLRNGMGQDQEQEISGESDDINNANVNNLVDSPDPHHRIALDQSIQKLHNDRFQPKKDYREECRQKREGTWQDPEDIRRQEEIRKEKENQQKIKNLVPQKIGQGQRAGSPKQPKALLGHGPPPGYYGIDLNKNQQCQQQSDSQSQQQSQSDNMYNMNTSTTYQQKDVDLKLPLGGYQGQAGGGGYGGGGGGGVSPSGLRTYLGPDRPDIYDFSKPQRQEGKAGPVGSPKAGQNRLDNLLTGNVSDIIEGSNLLKNSMNNGVNQNSNTSKVKIGGLAKNYHSGNAGSNSNGNSNQELLNQHITDPDRMIRRAVQEGISIQPPENALNNDGNINMNGTNSGGSAYSLIKDLVKQKKRHEGLGKTKLKEQADRICANDKYFIRDPDMLMD